MTLTSEDLAALEIPPSWIDSIDSMTISEWRKKYYNKTPDSKTMGRKKEIANNTREKVCVIKEMTQTPNMFKGNFFPRNLEEEKVKFFKEGNNPVFDMKESSEAREKLANTESAKVRFEHFHIAVNILDTVKKKFGGGLAYVQSCFGKKIDHMAASHKLAAYLSENNLEGEITTYWTPELVSSAKMMWHGLNTKYNKPDSRKFSLIIKNTPENLYLTEQGIMCLADHEIGTHYFRMFNDGYQPWFADKKSFGLRRNGREASATEEGLACLHTILHAHQKFLFSPALLYYTACKAEQMGFKELYDHLGIYISDCEQRWRLVTRVKRVIKHMSDKGGSGRDQCYLEGAIAILRNMDSIDFNLLYSGRICYDETNRVKRLARMDCLRFPRFLRDMDRYKRTLHQIGVINGIIEPKPPPLEKRLSAVKLPPFPGQRSSTNSSQQDTPVKPALKNNWTVPTPPLKRKPRESETQTPTPPSYSRSSETRETYCRKKLSSAASDSSTRGDATPDVKIRYSRRGRRKKLLKKRASSKNILRNKTGCTPVTESKSVEYFGSLERNL